MKNIQTISLVLLISLCAVILPVNAKDQSISSLGLCFGSAFHMSSIGYDVNKEVVEKSGQGLNTLKQAA